MIQALDIREDEPASRVLDLQLAAYSVEAGLVGSWELPPLKDTMDSLKSSGETFRGYFVDGELAGAVSFETDGDSLVICRLFVGPGYFRRGIASSLLRCVEAAGIERILVSTGARNTPARRLYEGHGFVAVGEEEVLPGLFIVRFRKEMR